MNQSKTLLIDVAVAAGLAFALLVVIVVDRVLPPPAGAEPRMKIVSTSSTDGSGPVREAIARPLRLAVTPTREDDLGKWDDMGKLLGLLGKGYTYSILPLKELYDARRLADFDVIFLTCAPGGTEDPVPGNLREFVYNGGTLYASDWRYDCVAKAFHDFTAPALAAEGYNRDVTAEVVDPGLRDLVGPTMPLLFNLTKWKTAAFRPDKVKVLLQGECVTQFGKKLKAPLLVKFSLGKGTVIFTSFHNERQNSEVELKLLRYLVFSAVTAKIESRVAQTMIQGGFSPRKTNLLSASSGSQEIRQSYEHKQAGKLRFVLGFENRGARLRLSVFSPTGEQFDQEGTSTLTIDLANAPAGRWEYVVTALEVPYANFPFNLTVGESD
jgi:hypothetical protein